MVSAEILALIFICANHLSTRYGIVQYQQKCRSAWAAWLCSVHLSRQVLSTICGIAFLLYLHWLPGYQLWSILCKSCCFALSVLTTCPWGTVLSTISISSTLLYFLLTISPPANAHYLQKWPLSYLRYPPVHQVFPPSAELAHPTIRRSGSLALSELTMCLPVIVQHPQKWPLCIICAAFFFRYVLSTIRRSGCNHVLSPIYKSGPFAFRWPPVHQILSIIRRSSNSVLSVLAICPPGILHHPQK